MTDFVTDLERWGFMERQEDGTHVFIPVPRTPLELGGLAPPITLTMWNGEQRHIVREPAP